MYLWLDYASVPQSSRAVQRLMIMSLPCIAATVDVFLVVAPRAIQGSVSVDAAYRAMPTHHTPTEFDAKGSSGQSAWAGVMPDAAAPPPTPVNRASNWPGWSR